VTRPKHAIKHALGVSVNTPWACCTTLPEGVATKVGIYRMLRWMLFPDRHSVYSILGRSFIRSGRINEPVLTEIKYTAATSFHGTADSDIKHVPPLSCSETASVATAPHTIPHHQTTTCLPAALSPPPIINFPSRVGGVSQSRQARSTL